MVVRRHPAYDNPHIVGDANVPAAFQLAGPGALPDLAAIGSVGVGAGAVAVARRRRNGEA